MENKREQNCKKKKREGGSKLKDGKHNKVESKVKGGFKTNVKYTIVDVVVFRTLCV